MVPCCVSTDSCGDPSGAGVGWQLLEHRAGPIARGILRWTATCIGHNERNFRCRGFADARLAGNCKSEPIPQTISPDVGFHKVKLGTIVPRGQE